MIPDAERFDPKPLTPELAQEQPDVYQQRLYELVPQYTKHSSGLIAENWLRGMKPDLILKPGSELSQDTGEAIEFGAVPWPDVMRKDWLIDGERFPGELEKVYILSHEASHQFTRIVIRPDSEAEIIEYENLSEIYRMFVKARRDKHLGFSKFGSKEFYEQPRNDGTLVEEIQATEDLAELVNAYLIDPQMLRRHLDAMCDPNNEEWRRQHKLMPLDAQSADTIYGVVDQAVKKYIGHSQGE